MGVEELKFVTLIRMHAEGDKSFTVELYSKSAEEAYVKEKTIDKLVETQSNIKKAELIGTFKRVTLKVIGEDI